MRISDWSSDVCSSDLRHGADIGLIAHGDARLAAADLDRNDLRRIDADEAVVEPLATCLARRDRIGEGLIAVVVAQVAQRVAVARPIGLRRCDRSEEHTSELPSLKSTSYAVLCLKK